MFKSPLVSIIIPAYNMEKYVKEAVNSALAQTYKNIEVIVVDDGSTDGTAKVLAPYARKKRIRYIYQENKGLAGARNTGIRKAGGEYIALLDADDIFFPEKMERQADYLDSHPECDVCYCDVWHFYEEEPDRMMHLNYHYYSGDAVFEKLLRKNFINPLSVVFRRSVFDRFGYFDEEVRQFAEDWDYWVKISWQGARFCFLPEVLAKYRIRRGSLSYDRSSEIKRKKTALNIFRRLSNKMSFWQKWRYRIYWTIFGQWLRLVYAFLANRIGVLRKFHFWLQERRLQAVAVPTVRSFAKESGYGRKRILITSEFYYPHTGGSFITRKLAEGLAEKGYQVTVATSDLKNRDFTELNGVSVKGFGVSGNRVRGFKGDVESYREFLKSGRFDAMLNYAAQCWSTDLALSLLDLIKARKLFVPLGYSKLNDSRYRKYYDDLSGALLNYDALIYLSRNYRDKLFGDAAGVNDRVKWIVIPNAADEEEFSEPTNPSEKMDFRKKYGIETPYLIVAVGNHDYAKDHFFLWEAARKLERTDYTLALIGKWQSWRSCAPLCFAAARILKPMRIFDKLNRDEVVAAFKSADLSLLTSFIETDPLVMYESFASKTPFISTPVGSVPEFRDFVKIVLNPDEMAGAVNEFLDDSRKRRAAAEKGFRLWNRKHRLSQMIDSYERIIND